uniref:Crooked neck-like protein 1 n=1 Tax=Tanacetum cinerariifolium TaxID=118510 RepID=A0A6L2P263_TANCI|nr:crooked neck-like protein 1 [Tanacetum cinerariifolium]
MASLGFVNRKETNVNIPRSTRVKNKSHAPIQITAEHIIQEARQLQQPENNHHASLKITDSIELQEYRLRKRNEYENQVRRGNKNVWVKYAKWEESQKDFERARSVWERALEADYKDHTIWLKYVDFEMKNKFVNHARNVFDRAVTLLPRVDKLWSKYIHMEKSIGNVVGAQQIHERWMIWNPDQQACRTEVICKEQYVDKDEAEDTIVSKKRFKYAEQVKNNPLDYDSWFDYIKLEESVGNKQMIREIYERAIANVPPAEEKRYWQRYIYLWINYSLYEEICAQDISRTRDVYNKCLKLLPHKSSPFRKRGYLRLTLKLDSQVFLEYIDFEIAEGKFERTRRLYKRLLDRFKHFMLWISYTLFEASAFEEVQLQGDVLQEQRQLCVRRVRRVFENAIDYHKTSPPELKEEMAMLLEEWLKMECSFGELDDMELVRVKLPKKLKKRRHIEINDCTDRYEEYIDYIFPEKLQASNLKILEQASKWKKRKCADLDISCGIITYTCTEVMLCQFCRSKFRSSNQVVADQLLQVVSELGFAGSLALEVLSADMKAQTKAELNKKADSAMILCLGNKVLREVTGETTAAGVWPKLETLYMTKSLANKLYLKKKLYTFYILAGRKISKHIDEFNKIVLDLTNIEVKFEDEDLALLLLTSLPASYEHFMDTLLYGREALTLEDVMAILNSKKGLAKRDDGEGLYVRGRTNRRDSRQSRGKGYARLDHGSRGSYHMTPRIDLLSDYLECNGGRVLLGDNKECKIRGIGKVRVQLKDGSSFVLHNVRYIPELKRNLISLGTLEKERYTVKLQSDKIKVINGSRVVLSGTRRDNCVYSLDDHAVAGELNASVEEKDNLPFGVGRHTTQGVIDYVHSDLWGPSQVESLRGKRYFLSIVDDYSRRTGRTIKKLRTDNGLEFCNREFKKLCIESGIARHLTVAGTPQQNGLAERINRTLKDKVRCLLIQSRFPKTLWAEATCMVAYLINRSPSIAIEKKTPMEMCSGHSKLYRLDNESPIIVTSRSVVFNESVMYKGTLKDSGAGTDKSVEELQVKVELQGLSNRTPEEDRTDREDGNDENARYQENDQTPELTDYQLVRDRELRIRTKLLRF